MAYEGEPEGRASAGQRLSKDESALALAIVRDWMRRLRIRSVYELFVLAEVRKSTLYRWMTCGSAVRLPIRSVRALASALATEAQSDEPLVEIERIVTLAEQRIRGEGSLMVEFRARGLSFQKAMSAIQAARHRVVPQEELP